MNEGQKIFFNSLVVFCVLCLSLLGFGFFVYPNLDISKQKGTEPVSEVLSVIDQQNPYAFVCPESFKKIHVPADHPTIQEAIDSVTSGAIINVAPGVYNEALVLKENVCLVAEEFGRTEIQGFSETVIEAKSNTQIKNFTISSIGNAEVGVSVVNAEMVNIEINSFNNFQYGVLSKGDSKLSVNANSFRNVDYAISLQDSLFFATQNNIESRKIGVEIINSGGEIIGKVIVGGEYGIKAKNSNVFLDKNILKNNSVAGMQLCLEGDYEIGNNFFDNVGEEILY